MTWPGSQEANHLLFSRWIPRKVPLETKTLPLSTLPTPPLHLPDGWLSQDLSTKDRQAGPGFKENEDSPLSTRLPHGGLRAARRAAVSPPAAETPRRPVLPAPSPLEQPAQNQKSALPRAKERLTHVGGGRGGAHAPGENSSWEITQGPCHYPEDQSGGSQPSIPGRGPGQGRGERLWEGLRAREDARPGPWAGLRPSTQPPGSASPFSMLLMFFR